MERLVASAGMRAWCARSRFLHVACVHTFLIWQVHTLSISDGRVDTCALSPSSEWLAFGCAALGQLLVWEWRAESYVLRQQGHFYAEVRARSREIARGGGCPA